MITRIAIVFQRACLRKLRPDRMEKRPSLPKLEYCNCLKSAILEIRLPVLQRLQTLGTVLYTVITS